MNYKCYYCGNNLVKDHGTSYKFYCVNHGKIFISFDLAGNEFNWIDMILNNNCRAFSTKTGFSELVISDRSFAPYKEKFYNINDYFLMTHSPEEAAKKIESIKRMYDIFI